MTADRELLAAVREVKKLSAGTRVCLLAKVKRSKMPRDVSDMVADVLAYPATVERVLVEMTSPA